MHLISKLSIAVVLLACINLSAYEEGFSVNDGVKIAYRDYGPTDGDPILLITGLGAQLTLWPDFLIQDLQKNNFRPIAIDNRDVGLSTRFTSKPSQLFNYLKYFLFLPIKAEYTIDDMAEDAIGVLDHLSIERAHILGMSMGGMISQVLVSSYPDRAKTFTMIASTASTPSPFNGPKFSVTQQLLKRSDKNDIDGRIKQSIRLFELIGTPGRNYDTLEFKDSMKAYIKRGGDDSGFLRQMSAILGSKNRKKMLRAITTPTLIIHGKNDPLIKVKNAHSAHKLISTSNLIIINEMGHLIDEGVYPDFQSQLIDFLKAYHDF